MVVLHQARTLTDAILVKLATTTIDIGDGVQPAGTGWQGTPGQSTFVPYAVVHPIAGGTTDVDGATIYDPHADSESLYQVSCFGATRAQCEFVSDAVFAAMVVPPYPTLVGRSILFVEADMEGGARRDDSVQPPIWQGVPRFRFSTTPS